MRGGLRTAHSSMPAQGGVKFSPTCDLDYQVRTKSGEGQLTAACPHRGASNSLLRVPRDAFLGVLW